MSLTHLHSEPSFARNPGCPPLVPATARGEATRRRLIDAAEEEFGSRGFYAASVSSVTARAKVGQGTFYLYFRAKDEIYRTLVEEIGRSLRQSIRESVRGVTDFKQAKQLALQAFVSYADRHGGRYRIVQETQFVDEAAFRDFYQRLVEELTDALSAGPDPQSEQQVEAAAWAIIGVGYFLGLSHSWRSSAVTQATVDSSLRLVEKQPLSG
ncbi:MAG: TetR/AcrR family transcriptional regulator [Panacagrimonas sp.]